ncbi:FitA-like ribbon-helix-helix domain-containing protein [Microbacterium sp. A93]|uniref:FitA-like ribbon-helix-helix domain-containing protein n=1 Tax=Microbacterium sp. A93 TaxID=3450716 RepID=UPI003F439C07
MSAITIRNLSEETHRALKARAVSNQRSTEAEVRAILDSAVAPRAKLGTLLTDIGLSVGGVDLDFDRGAEDRDPVDLS